VVHAVVLTVVHAVVLEVVVPAVLPRYVIFSFSIMLLVRLGHYL